MAQKPNQYEKLGGIGIIGMMFLVGYIAFNGLPGSGTGVFTSETPTLAPTEQVITGATSASLNILVKDYDRDPADSSAQFVYVTTVNASVLRTSDHVANSRYTNYTIGADTDPTISRGTEYVVVPVDGSYAALETELLTFKATVDPHDAELVVHALATEANMNVNCYDVDTGSELTAGSNTSQDTYNLTLSANELDVKTRCKYEVGASNVAYPLGAIATLAQNDIEDFYPSSMDFAGNTYTFEAGVVPKHMQSLTWDQGNIAGTQWEDIHMVKGGPIMLYGDGSSMLGANHKKAWVDFVVDTSGTDPTFASGTTSDIMCAIIKDYEPFIKQNGWYSFGIADDSDSETDAGRDETDTGPAQGAAGGNTGFCINGI